jgi:hypothetical protein
MKHEDVEYYKRCFTGAEDMFGLIFPALLLKPAPQIYIVEGGIGKLSGEYYDPISGEYYDPN